MERGWTFKSITNLNQTFPKCVIIYNVWYVFTQLLDYLTLFLLLWFIYFICERTAKLLHQACYLAKKSKKKWCSERYSKLRHSSVQICIAVFIFSIGNWFVLSFINVIIFLRYFSLLDCKYLFALDDYLRSVSSSLFHCYF